LNIRIHGYLAQMMVRSSSSPSHREMPTTFRSSARIRAAFKELEDAIVARLREAGRFHRRAGKP